MESSSVSRRPLVLGFLGADWWGSDARATAAEFRRRGHLVIERHYEDFLPTRWRHPVLKAVRRLLRPVMAADYNKAVRELLGVEALDALVVFKGMLLAPETLAAFRAAGTPCCCIYPDVSFTDHGPDIARCLPLYDKVFTTKAYHLRDAGVRSMAQDLELVPHGFDPEVHRPVDVSAAGFRCYACDVSFVGAHSVKKERLLGALIAALPELDVRIWGPGWQRAGEAVRRRWQGRGAYSDETTAIYCASKINLGLLSEAGGGQREGDATTARTWQIPAAGGFMLHEDTEDVRRAFTADSEIGLFHDAEDLPSAVTRWLADDSGRASAATAAHRRAHGAAYTYAPAVDAIEAWLHQRTGSGPAESCHLLQT